MAWLRLPGHRLRVVAVLARVDFGSAFLSRRTATPDSASGVTNSHAVAVHEYVVGAMMLPTVVHL